MRLPLLLTLLLLAAPAAAQPGGVTSAYTKLDLDKCAPLTPDGEPGWTEWRCEGFDRVSLYVQSADDRYDLDAGARDEDARWSASFDYPGDTVEWRLKDGRPFAIIYRLRNANPELPARSTLVVEAVGSEGKTGCRVAEVDGATADANTVARRAADDLLAKPAECLTAN